MRVVMLTTAGVLVAVFGVPISGLEIDLVHDLGIE